MKSPKVVVVAFLNALGKIVGAFVLLFVAVFAFDTYKKSPLQEFCSALSPSLASGEVLALAESRGFFAYDAIQSRGVISVLNQESPFFRYACVVKFVDGRQTQKRVIVAD